MGTINLTSWSEAADPFVLQLPGWSAHAGGARHLAQHCQAVAAGWMAEQPAGHLGPGRPPPSAVKIIADVLLDQSGAHAPDLLEVETTFESSFSWLVPQPACHIKVNRI